ncbi:MAG: glycosyltransferase [Clostridia bacterium]|nr:glycosyltransferase [Clostridia bacterium]
MLLYNIIFPKRDLCDETDLYYRINGTTDTLYDNRFENNEMIINKDEKASFDSYFNIFSYAQYKEHTSIKAIIINATLKGKGKIRVKKTYTLDNIYFRYCHLYDNREKYYKFNRKEQKQKEAELIDEVLLEQDFDFKDFKDVAFNLDISKQDFRGYIYLEIEAKEASIFKGANYLVDGLAAHNVKVGIVLCTYKREEYLKNNVKKLIALKNNNPDLKNKFDVFVIDNGKTLSNDDVKGAILIPNENTGGSGGYTRGVKEVCANKEYTHFLLVDDDTSFEEEIFRKTITMLSFAKDIEELTIGASMMKMEKPYIQHEQGAYFDGIWCIPHNGGYDLRRKIALLGNEEELNVDYQAWWYFCMPVSFVDRYGLPLQLFIRGDDQEYGLRCTKELCIMNGIGLWHESFENKFSPHMEYYNVRNNILISTVIKHKTSGYQQFKKMRVIYAKNLVEQRYFMFPILNRALEDFFKGPEYIFNVDVTKLNSEIMGMNIKQYSKSELEVQGYDVSSLYEEHKFMRGKTPLRVLTLNGYLIPTAFYPKASRTRVVDLRYPTLYKYFLAKTVVQYNPVLEKGFVTNIKKYELIKVYFNLAKLFFMLVFGYKGMKKKYNKYFETNKNIARND